MKSFLKPGYILHTFLIVLFFVASTYAHNIYSIEPGQLVVPVLVLFSATAPALVMAKLILKKWAKAGFCVSFFWLVIFCYEAVHSSIQTHFNGTLFVKHSLLLILFFILMGVWILYLRVNSVSLKAVKIANFFSITLLVLPAYTIASYHIKRPQGVAATEKFADQLYSESNITTANLPDIVFLMLDGYGRADQLQKNYDFDNTSFVHSLEENRFQVASQSYSNYCRTAVSLASTLNLNYLQNLSGYKTEQSYDVLDKLADEASVIHFLKKHNYNIASFSTGFKVTDLTKHAVHFAPHQPTVEDFNYLLISKTPLVVVEQNNFLNQLYRSAVASNLQKDTPYQKFRSHQRDRTLFTLQNIPKALGKKQPSFVFADVFVGHPPFIFNSDGHYKAPTTSVPAADGSFYMEYNRKSREDYIQGLREQTKYLNTQILNFVKHLQQTNARPTIIILQGDHGPGAFYHQTSVADTDLQDRFSILSAIYLPDPYYVDLPEDLTPVNTLRLILNRVFNTKLSTLPNKQYYSGYHTPCTFIEVTNQLTPTPRKTPALHGY